MPRLARIKIDDGGAFYHLYCRTAGPKGEYPLDSPLVRRKIIAFFEHFSRVYCCRILGFCIMGNHYHLVVWFDERRKMSREELFERARVLYPKTLLKGWLRDSWKRFEERIFDVSEFMRNFQAAAARWYNYTFARRGRFWAERFKSTLLEDEEQVMDCLLYVELNAVRAGIASHPEDYEGASVYYRDLSKDNWMMPLQNLVGQEKRGMALRDYKAMIYYRGNVSTKAGQKPIPNRIVEQEEARDFKTKGIYRKRWRHFVDGVVIGSRAYVQQEIDRLREQGIYLRRKHPVEQLNGHHNSLREQRTLREPELAF